MKVVSNTSPIYYLLIIDEVHLLPDLFGEIIIPEAVASELAVQGAPDLVRNWIKYPPPWLKIRAVTISISPVLRRLHPGEQEAIALAQQILADLVILDEKIARQIAIGQNLNITGLLGILDIAATQNLTNLSAAIERLQRTNFRVSPHLLKILLDKRKL